MSKSIIWIVDGWTYWDATNGNSYHLTRITHTGTGHALILEECEGNARSYINKAQEKFTGTPWAHSQTHTGTYESVPYRRWQQMRKSSFYAPIDQYHRTPRGKVTNTTVKQINQLRRKSQ